MNSIGLSKHAAEAHPTLAAWMSGVGMPVAIMDANLPRGRDEARILEISERGHATHRDLLIEAADGEPSYVPAHGGMPATIRFGFADMAFGNALIAELVRPAGRPACGEPESVRFFALAERVATSEATVLVLGETGTGKEGVARFIHDRSPRAASPFVAINCAALPETMLEAMLFGHQKGAFTGAGSAGEGLFRAADGGTLFLDEIAELPLALQAKLLRALQEKEILPVGATRSLKVDVRIVAAANRDLAAEVAAGRFRADLYWRLNVMPLTLRPLAERRQDVRAIAAALLIRHTPAVAAFAWPTACALDRLMAHRWPGNVRELENVLQRAILLHDGDRIAAADLAIDALVGAPAPQPLPARTAPEPVSAETSLRLADIARSLQVRAIEDALAATRGHRVRAAERLGISERTLRYRLAEMRAAA